MIKQFVEMINTYRAGVFVPCSIFYYSKFAGQVKSITGREI